MRLFNILLSPATGILRIGRGAQRSFLSLLKLHLQTLNFSFRPSIGCQLHFNIWGTSGNIFCLGGGLFGCHCLLHPLSRQVLRPIRFLIPAAYMGSRRAHSRDDSQGIAKQNKYCINRQGKSEKLSYVNAPQYSSLHPC